MRSIAASLTRLKDHADDFLNGRCAVCGAGCRSALCERCRLDTPPLSIQRSPIAGVPVWCAGLYDGRLAELIRQLKYGDETRWASPLGRVLWHRAQQVVPPHLCDAAGPLDLIPVPLHPRRLASRGYNQSALLARALARAAGRQLRVRTDVLERTHDTAAQAQLDARARQGNVAGAFKVRLRPTRPLIVLDDVVTTGATLRGCILCLQEAGAIVRLAVTVASAAELQLSRPPSSLPDNRHGPSPADRDPH